MPSRWDDEVDGILGGDLTAALAYPTPAGGAVVTAVAPLGLRDREAGVVRFTTSTGFGGKLDRIRSDARVALAYHAREHGFSGSARYVLVQGRALAREHDPAALEALAPQVERFLGAPKRGRQFWDRWLRASAAAADRVIVDVTVERILSWPSTDCLGGPTVTGTPPPELLAPPQEPPRDGTAPRVNAARAAHRLARLPHRLVAIRGADGYPLVLPFHALDATDADAHGIDLTIAGPGLDPGGRRAGLLAHDDRPQLAGLRVRQTTGWIEVTPDRNRARYAPHTEHSSRTGRAHAHTRPASALAPARTPR